MSDGCERAFCRETAQQMQQEAAAVAGGGGSASPGGEKSGFVDPRKYRNPLPFNLKNPYAFTTKFFLISTVGFAAPYLVVLYQMYKMGRTS